MQHKVSRRYSQHDACHTADDECHHKADQPVHRQFVTDPSLVHREQPVEHLRTRRDRNDHRCYSKEGVDGRTCSHREEMMQPDHIRKKHDRTCRVDHRRVAEQPLARERRCNFRKDAKSREDQDVNFRMTPHPDQVHVHHRVTAEIVREEVGVQIAVCGQQRKRCRQYRECRHDQDVGAKRGPGENRHFHQRHPRCAHLDDGRNEVDARQRCSDAGYLQTPDVVVHTDARAVIGTRQRRIGQPAGLCEFSYE